MEEVRVRALTIAVFESRREVFVTIHHCDLPVVWGGPSGGFRKKSHYFLSRIVACGKECEKKRKKKLHKKILFY